MHLPPGCQHSWCSLSWSSPPSLSFGARAKHQHGASLAGGDALSGNSDVPSVAMLQEQAVVGLVQLGGSSTGRTQHWEMSVNSALCYWRVSTSRCLIIPALIKDWVGGASAFPLGSEGSAAPAVPPGAAAAFAHTLPLLHPELKLQPCTVALKAALLLVTGSCQEIWDRLLLKCLLGADFCSSRTAESL